LVQEPSGNYWTIGEYSDIVQYKRVIRQLHDQLAQGLPLKSAQNYLQANTLQSAQATA
jgi:hypothetical protein